MERVYACGVICIEYIQQWFSDSQNYFEFVNDISNPHHSLEIIFPLVSALDSVFASQFLLCMAFGQWLNSVMKWWILEDRPYWWVQETTFYSKESRPYLQQTPQTCETGPGSPSGHSSTMAMQLMLYIMWISHVMNDRKYYLWWWKYLVYPVFTIALVSVMLARMFVASHFPHQTLIGGSVGLFLAPALCIYVTDPYIWGRNARVSRDMFWHCVSAVTTIAISVVTYLSLKVFGVDPQWSVKLAFRYCENPSWIHVSSTPMFALVQSTACLVGWALCVTPSVANYRHYTKRRSLIIAAVATCLLVYLLHEIQSQIDRDTAWKFYSLQFLFYVLKSVVFVRAVPWLAMWPYGLKSHQKQD